MVEGMENGRLSEKYAIARNLKEAGVSKSLIVQCIGLSEEKIERFIVFFLKTVEGRDVRIILSGESV